MDASAARLTHRAGPVRSGRLRVAGPRGTLLIRFRATQRSVTVLARVSQGDEAVAILVGGGPGAFARRLSRTVGPRCVTRTSIDEDFWDLQPGGSGPGSVEWAFSALLDAIGLGLRAAPDLRRARPLLRARRWLGTLGGELVRRRDPVARQVAATFPVHLRSWVYRQIVGDPTGRIAQIASVCPGLLVVAFVWSEEVVASPGDRDSLLPGIVQGLPLRTLLLDAARRSLAPELIEVVNSGPAGYRLRCLGPEELRPVIEARSLLIRRARAAVQVLDLLDVPPPGFAPEDIPRDPSGNAHWFAVMSRSQAVLGEIVEPELRAGLSAFVSRNFALVASRACGSIPRPRPPEVDGPGIVELLRRIIRHTRLTGHAPRRSCNARKLLAQVEAWHREQSEDWAAAKSLGCLLRRLEGLALGEVTSVESLGNGVALEGLGRITFPRGPRIQDRLGPGLEVRPIETPEALAAEGTAQNHCVATWLPEILAGRVWIYSARHADVRITVAVGRDVHGTFKIQEARLAHDRRPSATQLRLLDDWVRKVNATEGSNPAERGRFLTSVNESAAT